MRNPLMAALALSLVSTTAYAAQPEDADEAARAGTGSDGTAVYDFEDDNVDGELLKPEGANIGSRGAVKHASMITIRPHFIAELNNMANDV